MYVVSPLKSLEYNEGKQLSRHRYSVAWEMHHLFVDSLKTFIKDTTLS